EHGDDEHEHHEEGFSRIVPGLLLPLKDQLDKNKEAILQRLTDYMLRKGNSVMK
nr:hypothetical protein [Tanacetum cinerariifolium]